MHIVPPVPVVGPVAVPFIVEETAPNTGQLNTRVGFYPGSDPLFGLSGFLEFFTATFNGEKRQVTLLSNKRLPRTAAS
jgi:hypothetical protein